MEGRRDAWVLFWIVCLLSSLCIEDSVHFVSAARLRHLPPKRLVDRNSVSEEELPSPPRAYRSNEELLAYMREFTTRCSNISRLYTIGKSVNGVPLKVIEISDFPGQLEPEPAFKYVGNLHGDEPSGRELVMHLAEWLCANYLTDSLATLIVQNVHLHLLPSMNPDGFDRKTRNNAKNIDLNRDFPDQFYPIYNNESDRQPETRAIMQWIRDTRFTASASLHEGALVASYGWDGTSTGKTGYAESPDDGAFRYMASLYAEFNTMMKKSHSFHGGITNGAEWYPLYGGMQDWNYIHGNCFEVTLEMNDDKWPDISKIPELWEQHRQSMLELVASLIKSGVHGRVVSSVDGRPLPAVITVQGNGHKMNASATFGDYHRILPPEKVYEFTVELPGYVSSTTTIFLPQNNATRLDFVLDPLPSGDKQAQPNLLGFPRAPVTSAMVIQTEKDQLSIRCAGAGFSETGQAPPSRRIVHMMQSVEDMDLLSDIMLEHFKVISAGGTLILVGGFLFLLIRWRGGPRLQSSRNTLRKI